MKSTGIVRRIDELGRIVIPIEIRKQFGITDRDPIEIFVSEDSIVLKKFSHSCIFCGDGEVVLIMDKPICPKCINRIADIKK